MPKFKIVLNEMVQVHSTYVVEGDNLKNAMRKIDNSNPDDVSYPSDGVVETLGTVSITKNGKPMHPTSNGWKVSK